MIFLDVYKYIYSVLIASVNLDYKFFEDIDSQVNIFVLAKHILETKRIN